jgi:hypothetical protein
MKDKQPSRFDIFAVFIIIAFLYFSISLIGRMSRERNGIDSRSLRSLEIERLNLSIELLERQIGEWK